MYWRESVLAVLASQIRNANASLQRASAASVGSPAGAGPATRAGAGSPPLGRHATRNEDGFKDLLKASGFLEALPTEEADLEQLEVVLTEDDRRNPRKRH
jgi:hypothetical protein